MIQYEMLLLIRPDLTQEKQDEVKSRVEKVVQEEQGTVSTYDKWGKYLLAYPVEKCAYGIYVLMRFSVAKEHAHALAEKLKSLCLVRFSTAVMRHMIVRLDPNAPAEYRRPDSLEDAPRRDKPYDFDSSWNRSSDRSSAHAAGASEAHLVEELVEHGGSVLGEE